MRSRAEVNPSRFEHDHWILPQAEFSELFGIRLRYTGASLGYQLAAPVAGSLSPVITVGLVQAYLGQSWPLAQSVILISVVSLACVQLLAETSRKDLTTAD